MHPTVHAESQPDHPALIMAGSGATMSYAELDRRSNQVAQLLRARGLKRGQAVAIMLKNVIEYFELAWGCQRAGLFYTCLSSQLSVDEASYIVRDCGAQLFFTDAGFGDLAVEIVGIADDAAHQLVFQLLGILDQLDGGEPALGIGHELALAHDGDAGFIGRLNGH